MWSVGIIFALFFLILINQTDFSDAEIDAVFEGIDQNTMERIEVKGDSDLNQFIRYTAKGMAQEFHGGYYLVKWINGFLPELLVDNLNLILLLIVLAIVSPVIFYGTLTVLVLVMVAKEIWTNRRRRK